MKTIPVEQRTCATCRLSFNCSRRICIHGEPRTDIVITTDLWDESKASLEARADEYIAGLETARNEMQGAIKALQNKVAHLKEKLRSARQRLTACTKKVGG
jgi:hypothetical protein